jgi:SAM-dependent methyltransferase
MYIENNCPFCGKQEKVIIGEPKISKSAEQFIRNDYEVVMCSSCRFYFINPEIDFTEDEWSRLYGEQYFGMQTTWHKKERLRNLKKRFDRIKQTSRNEIRNFLDIGSGEGLALIESEARGWNTYGIDITDNRIPKAKVENIKFILGDLLKADFPKNFFEVIYMDSVLEHLINPLDYLKELNRILNPGGIVYIGVPNEDSLFNDFRKIVFAITGNGNISEKIKPFESPYHAAGFTQKSLRTAAEKGGFKVLGIINFAARFEFMKYPLFSRGFWVHFLTLPIDLAAFVLRREVYLETFLTK